MVGSGKAPPLESGANLINIATASVFLANYFVQKTL